MKLTKIDIVFLLAVVALFLCLVPPEYLFNAQRLVGGDTTAHSYYPTVVKEQCLPSFQFMCWSNDLLMGYVVLQHYFPLTFVAGALLGYLMPVEIAFKLVVLVSIMSPPVALFLTGRLLGIRGYAPALAGISVLLLMFVEHNHHVGFYILDNLSGQFSSTLALSLFFCGIALFKRSVEKGSWGISAGFVLGCSFLAHAMLIPMLAGLTYALLFILWRRDSQFFKSALGSGLMSGAMFSGWALPFVFDVNRDESAATSKVVDYSFYSQFFDAKTSVVVALGLIGLLLCLRNRRRASFNILFSITLAFLLLTVVSLIGNSIGRLAVFDRFFPGLLMALCLTAGIAAQRALLKLPKSVRRICVCGGIILGCFSALQGNEAAQRWARWNFEGMNPKPYGAVYRALGEKLRELPGNGRVAMFPMNNSILTAGLTGPFAWETIGLLAKKPILVTGTQGFYTLSFRGVGEHYYAGVASADPLRFTAFNRLYAVSYLVKPAKLPVPALATEGTLLATMQASSREDWEIYDVTKQSGNTSFVHPVRHAPVIYDGSLGKVDLMRNLFHEETSLDKVLMPVIVGGNNLQSVGVFQHVKDLRDVQPSAINRECVITDEKIEREKISFHTTCPDTPHHISISYNRGWHSANGEEIYQVIPNHMVMVPKTEHVTISMRLTPAGLVGRTLTITALLTFVAAIFWGIARSLRSFFNASSHKR